MESVDLSFLKNILGSGESMLIPIVTIGSVIVIALLLMLKLNFMSMRRVDRRKLEEFKAKNEI